MFIETHYPMLGFVVVVVWLLFVKLSLIEDARYPSWVWGVIQWVTSLLPVCTFVGGIIALPLDIPTAIILGALNGSVTAIGIAAIRSDRWPHWPHDYGAGFQFSKE
ncbi:cytochrome c oxidase subunit [Lasius niger]|uniref:Cytochrome c oxidase subunit n=1 Tax=Lasius niger TaxID=67767 RepID=A0A0J7JX71_LASNI|nr:cytochrome c oxidase subunit [Lasius niger]